jgi:hypothetical protein
MSRDSRTKHPLQMLKDSIEIKSVQEHPKPVISPEMKSKAEQFHAQGYSARKKGDYSLAIQLYS